MVIANGFVTATPAEALLQVRDRCDGHEVRTAVASVARNGSSTSVCRAIKELKVEFRKDIAV